MARALHMGVVASQGGGAAGPLIDFADLTGDRASEAAFWDPRTPAFEQGVGDAWRTVENTSDFSGWSRVDAAITADVDGVADEFADTSAAGYGRVYEDHVVSPGKSCTVRWSIKIKQDSNTTRFPLIHTNLGGIASFSLNTQTGATSARIGSFDVLTVTDDGAGYWEIVMARTNTAGASTFTSTIYVAYSATLAGSGDASLTDSIIAKDSHVEHNDAGWLPDDVLRIFSDGALLIEESRTNYIDFAREFAAGEGSWISSGTRTAGADDGPDGASGTGTRQETASGGVGSSQVNIATPTGPVRVSAFYKESSLNPGASYQLLGWYGSDLAAVGGAATSAWVRRSVQTDNVNAQRSVRINAGNDWSAYGGVAAGDRDAVIDLIQMEAGYWDTSPIRTSGGSAARALEYGTLASAPATMRSGRWLQRIRLLGSSSEIYSAGASQTVYGYAGASPTYDRIYVEPGSASGSARIVVRQGNAVRVSTGDLTFSALQRLAITFDSAAGTVTVSGATSGDGTHSGTAWTFADTTLYVGVNGATSGSFNGVIEQPEAA